VDIDINNVNRVPLFRVTIAPSEKPAQVSPPTGTPGDAVPLDWTDAVDGQGTLNRCPVCRCDELFSRRDFPQRLGLTIVVVCAVASIVLFFMGQIIWCMAVLLAAVVADRVISLFTGKCIVCYRCRSEFRGLPIPRDYPTWDLSTGEKYRDHPGEAG
jgi:hypothetical protein